MTQAEPDGMTRRERDDLAKHVRKREKVEKTKAAKRKAELKAVFEAQLASIYTPDDDATFRELYHTASEVVEEADKRIAERCRELGIPERMRPQLSLNWWGRGENALAERRTELRTVANARLDAMEKTAREAIEERALAIQEQLLVGGLTTDAAKEFLAQLPDVQQLMPALDVEEVERLTAKEEALERRRRQDELALLGA